MDLNRITAVVIINEYIAQHERYVLEIEKGIEADELHLKNLYTQRDAELECIARLRASIEKLET